MSEIILASASSSRFALLTGAGVAFRAIAPSIDEDELKEKLLRKDAKAPEVADALAEAKALAVSQDHPRSLVLGSDQVLLCGGKILSKASDITAAREVLRTLRGREHQLISAAVLARAGQTLWRHSETATLAMRDFSDAFVLDYLASEGDAILGSVGCYRIEGRGAQLFNRVEGDHFVVRGLPLLAVLAELRRHGAIGS